MTLKLTLAKGQCHLRLTCKFAILTASKPLILLGISYRDHVTNEEVGNRIRQAIGPYEDLLTTVKKRKLRWYGHKTRSTGLAKMILQGTVQGGRRRGRQKKRWEDNVTEWTGLKLGEALRKAENREEWRTVVARSSLVPQRSTRLWDK